MARSLVIRVALVAGAIALGLLWSTASSPAAVEMSTGIRYVAQNESVDSCSAKAKTALNAYLSNAGETSPGTGQWLAYGTLDPTGHSTASAAIHCFPVGNGYVVTFTCAVQIPENGFNASDLCSRIYANFRGRETAPLPTPTPIAAPTGCSTANLGGTWTNDGKTFTFAPDGSLTDNDNVSGNWNLSGSTVTLTYYGTHTLTLSPDGKHLTGAGYNFNRKC